jgi:hypothetical protein
MRNLLIIFLLSTLLISSTAFARAQNETPSPIPSEVKYELAYPGMLPDNALYKLKVLRDKITLGLIQDPMKKIEQHLLLADKRISMSRMLVDKGNIELAKETALKGENEYTLLVFELKDMGKKPNKSLFNKLELAALKHQEVLNNIIAKVEEKDKRTFQTVVEFSKRNAEELATIYKNY